jgi:hypothetical protein
MQTEKSSKSGNDSASLGAALHAIGQATNRKHERNDDDDARAYCKATGGVVELRHAVYGTNNDPSAWLWLAGVERFANTQLRTARRFLCRWKR